MSTQERGVVLGRTAGGRTRGDDATTDCTEWSHAAVQGDGSFSNLSHLSHHSPSSPCAV